MASLERKWTFFFILVFLAIAETESTFLHEYGDVEAWNGTFKFEGDSLELDCNITNPSLMENSSMLHFERNTKNDNSVIAPEFIEILNTRSIRLRRSDLEVSEDGIYTCYQDTFNGGTRVIGSQRIDVDYEPQEVKDITCLVYNWESMTCSWDLGVKFQHPEYINVSLTWAVQLPKGSRSDSDQHDCPDLQHKTACHWAAVNYTHGHMYLMGVDVSTVINGKLLATKASKTFRVETQFYEESDRMEYQNQYPDYIPVVANVEPAPVDKFQAVVKNSSCVELQWQHSAKGREKFFVAESKVADEDKWTLILLSMNLNEPYQFLVCSLTPYTNYTFRMSVLPYPVDTTEPITQGHRSQWVNDTAQTSEDVPGDAPNICLGCFTDIKCPEKNAARCVRLYWQDLKDSKKNGILTNYRMTYSSETKNSTSVIVPVEKSKRLSVDLKLPTANQTYKINISPCTRVGFSSSPSLLLLPAVQRKPNPPPNFLVEVDKKQFGVEIIFYLSWAALNSDAKTGLKYNTVTIVWCLRHKHNKIPECKDDIQWIEVPADHVTYELKLPAGTYQHSDFLIGITAEVISDGQTLSSGIYWSTCTFHRNEQPRNFPKNVHQSALHPVNGLTIIWDRFECAEEDSFITEYLVKYCPTYDDTKCSEPEKTVNVSNNAGEVTLENLKGDTRYLVHVTAVSSAGLGPSKSIVSKLVKSSPPHEDQLNIAMIAGVFLAFVISVILALLIWCCFKRRKKIPNTKNILYEEPMDISNKKNQAFQNRPLPKTPEEQHFYGSSACMNNHGCEKAKDNSSGSYSEESVTSQSHLLSSNIPINQTSLSTVSEKLPKTKHTTKTAKTDPAREERQSLLNDTSSHRTNGPTVDTKTRSESESKDSTSQPDYFVIGDNVDCSSSRMQSSKLGSVSGKPSSSNPVPLSSQDIADYHQLGSAESEASTTVDLIDSTVLSFSNTNTLPLRGQNMEMSVFPVRLSLINPLSSSVLEDHGFVTELGHPTLLNSTSFQNKTPSVDSTKAAPHASLSESENSGYMAHSQIEPQLVHDNNQSLGYSRFAENPQSDRHDASLESVSNCFSSSASSPPSPCPVDTCLSSYPVSLPYLSDPQFQLPLYDMYVPDSAAMTPQHSFNNNNDGYTPLEAFTKITAADNLPVCPTCLTNEPNQNPASNPSYVWNIPSANNLDIYVDNIPQIDHHNDNYRPLVIGDYLYNPSMTAATLPRNVSSDSATLLLPSALSRPLSGDLLQLPHHYYEDPTLDGSNPTLTEL